MTLLQEKLESRKSYIIEAYNKGVSATALGKEFNCNGGSIWLFLKKCGIEFHKTSDVDSQKEKILNLCNQDVSAYRISEQLKIPLTSLVRKLKEWDVDISHRSKIREDFIKNHTEEIIRRYNDGESECKIAQSFSCADSSICRLLRENGVETRYHYSADHNFFSNIDNQIKAYTLGYFTADGCNYSQNNIISFASNDLCILKRFKKELKYDGPIYQCKNAKSNNLAYTLSVSSAQMSEDLTKLGCPVRKSLITYMPSLRQDLVRHYIRGLMDGDGSISYAKKHKNYIFQLAGMYNLLKPIQDFINSELNLQGCLSPAGKIHLLKYGGNPQTKKILDWLYSDATIYLPRKYGVYRKLLKLSPIGVYKDRENPILYKDSPCQLSELSTE